MREAISLLATFLAIGICWRFARSTMSSVGAFFVTVAVATITWNDVKPFAIPLSDMLLLFCAPPIALALLRRQVQPRLPLASVFGLLSVTLAIILNAVYPVSQAYADARGASISLISRVAIAAPEGTRALTDLVVGLKLELGLLVLPLALVVVAPDRRRLQTIFDLWGISAVVNAFVADLDSTGVTHVSGYLLGPTGGRQAGLTNHPNHLAMVCVMALPVVLAWWPRGHTWRRTSVVSLALLAMAIYVSGSRGGLAAGVAIVAVAVASRADVRRAVLPALLPAACAVAALLVTDRGLIGSLLGHTRFSTSNAARSDEIRAAVHQQAVADFLHRPLQGIGFEVADSGHAIYLQVLAAGGILTAVGLFAYLGGVVSQIRPLLRDELWNMEIACVVSVLAWLVLGSVENDFAERYPYVPFAMLVAIGAVRAADHLRPPVPGEKRVEALAETGGLVDG